MPKQTNQRPSRVTNSPGDLEETLETFANESRDAHAQRRATSFTTPFEIDDASISSETMAATATTTATAAALSTRDPPSTHEADLHEYTRMGSTLIQNARAELDLDDKFDAKPKNLKAFMQELQDRALDCCWKQHGILTFQVDGKDHHLFRDHGLISLKNLQDTASICLVDTSDAGVSGNQQSNK
jgi:hypothetical protein